MRFLTRPAIVAIGAASILLAGPAAFAAGKQTVYDNVPAPLPGNVASIGLEATAASEFGGEVQLTGSKRQKATITVVMSSWACQTGTWSAGNCGSAKNANFAWPITLRVYRVGAGNEPGTLVGAVTHTVTMPYRPSANYAKCTGDQSGEWYDVNDASCYNGKAFTVTFSMGSLDLPSQAIISVAYDTTHYGYDPVGESASCFSQAAGCPYDALNIGTGDSPASMGSQPAPDDAYFNSQAGGEYCDGGAGGTGTFRLDAGCWTGYQPAFRVTAAK